MGTATYMVLTRERRELMREWVRPLHEALHQPLGLAEQTDPRRYLHVPKNFTDDDAQIRIDLPTRLGLSRDMVADLITQKLALQGVTFSWHPEGRKPYVLVKKTRKPPAISLFKDPKTRELVAKAKESAPIIGFGAGGRIVSVDLDAESPHILVNASTGGNEILGRQLRMHVLLVAQSATARALGGPEVREQFSTRILARYSVNAWRMLAPEVHPALKSTKHAGRAQVVTGGSATETQVLFCTEPEAHEWAHRQDGSGRTAAPRHPRTAGPARAPQTRPARLLPGRPLERPRPAARRRRPHPGRRRARRPGDVADGSGTW
ncbi:hypothetical protein ABT185_16755 [Streptomyces clavifer]|uniref:hypothetical protein n=1 Tax=Streptomyces clavifer TaxID=68188 RepID=UPI0033165F6D